MATIFATTGVGKEAKSAAAPPKPTVRWIEGMGVQEIIAALAGGEVRFVHFEDPALFADAGRCLQLCVMLRERRINILWSARMNEAFGGGRLRVMRMAGCRRIAAAVGDDVLSEFRDQARLFGYAYVFSRRDGTVLDSRDDPYTVAELEAVAERLPGVHSVQFDLAVAYFRAGRFDEVMGPLGRAMGLGFPANESSMHLLTCLKGAKEYPDLPVERFEPAGPDSPYPLTMRNRRLVSDWLEAGCDIGNARMLLDPATEAVPFY